ncbi:MAG: hypothetical protein ACLU4N_13740 [Butyricimonas faecihominis]
MKHWKILDDWLAGTISGILPFGKCKELHFSGFLKRYEDAEDIENGDGIYRG